MSRVGETGVGEMGIGETGVGEMGVGEAGPNQFMTYLKYIRKSCPRNIYPLKPHFYIVKLGFARVHIFFLFWLQNIDCGYSLEPPRRGGYNMYPQSMFWAKIRKISNFF